MDGKYPSDSYAFTARQKNIIKKWIQVEIAENDKLLEDGFDIHVDQICKRKGRYKKYWISMAISLAYYANQYIQEIGRTDIMGIVAIPLYANEQFMMGVDFKNLEDIQKEFGVTPPSLSIYYKKSMVDQHTVSLGKLFIGQNPFKVLGYEFFIEEDPVKREPVIHGRGVRLLPATIQV